MHDVPRLRSLSGSFCVRIDHHFMLMLCWTRLGVAFFSAHGIMIPSRGRALVARQAHNLKAAGSIPASATRIVLKNI